MKIITLISLAMLLAGCSLTTDTKFSEKVQILLTNLLPPDYSGDFSVDEHLPWLNLKGKFTGLRRTADGTKWTWSGFKYERTGFANTGATIEQNPSPKIP